MREPCRLCGSNDGYIEERSGTELCRLRRLQFVGLQLTKTHGLRMTNDSVGRLGEAALNYAKRGWHVFPLHHPVNGTCSCGKDDCPSPGKHPRTEHGLSDATTDPEIITRWWGEDPNANIGVRTGKISGIVVVDVDAKNGGIESWQDLQDFNGRVDTLTSLTGGVGLHLFFQAPAEELKSTTGNMVPGIDTRAEGGYVVMPPSLHVSGRRYRWEEHDDYEDMD